MWQQDTIPLLSIQRYFLKYLLKSVHSIIKDQSYMLYRLSSNKLERLIFPLKDYSKQEIREIALKNWLRNT